MRARGMPLEGPELQPLGQNRACAQKVRGITGLGFKSQEAGVLRLAEYGDRGDRKWR